MLLQAVPARATDPAVALAKEWLRRTSLPAAALNPTVPTPPGKIVRRGSSPLAASLEVTSEAPIPRFTFDIFDRDAVAQFHRTYRAAFYPVTWDFLGAVPIVNSNGVILAPTLPTQAADQAAQIAFKAFRYRAGFRDTHIDPAASIKALHAATFVVSRVEGAFDWPRIHNARNDPQVLSFGPFRTPEALDGVSRGNLGWGLIIDGAYWSDIAHDKFVYGLRRTFGLASSHGRYLAKCLYLGPDRAEPDELTDGFMLSKRGYVQVGSAPPTGLWAFIPGIEFAPDGENMNQLLRIYLDYPVSAGRKESRTTFEISTTQLIHTGLPPGFGEAISLNKDPAKNRVNLRFEYRNSIGAPWKTNRTFVEYFAPQTAAEKIPQAAVAWVSRAGDQLNIDVVAPPGLDSRVQLKAKAGLNEPWQEVAVFQPNLVVSRLAVPVSALPTGACFLAAEIVQYRLSEAEAARAAGIPEHQITQPPSPAPGN
jgi:hypothetical protein